VLLVTLDTTRADRLGAYGCEAARTPALDAFAQSAVVFERAYATSSWTLPSHASLFTGLLPHQHGAQTAPDGQSETLGYAVRPLGAQFVTLAERLSDAGYRTAAVIAGPALKRELGLAQGFEFYADDLGGAAGAIHGKRARQVADQAIAFVEEFGAEPWFLFVNFFDPHAPYRPPPPDDRGLPVVDPGPLTRALVERLVSGEAPVQRPAWEQHALDDLLAGYDAEIAYMDRQLGRLLAAVEASPRGDDTLIAITADHGESFGEHDFLSHGAHLYEDNVRVPLIVRRPREPAAGSRIAAPVQNHRLHGLVLETAGVAPPGTFPRLDEPATLVTEVGASDANVRLFGPFFDRRLTALYDPPLKLIVSSRGDAELYDLERDPAERVDLAADDAARTAALRTELERFRADHAALYDPSARADLSPETRKALRALGYLE
jgi:arylsulfatase A-like enzyme